MNICYAKSMARFYQTHQAIVDVYSSLQRFSRFVSFVQSYLHDEENNVVEVLAGDQTELNEINISGLKFRQRCMTEVVEQSKIQESSLVEDTSVFDLTNPNALDGRVQHKSQKSLEIFEERPDKYVVSIALIELSDDSLDKAPALVESFFERFKITEKYLNTFAIVLVNNAASQLLSPQIQKKYFKKFNNSNLVFTASDRIYEEYKHAFHFVFDNYEQSYLHKIKQNSSKRIKNRVLELTAFFQLLHLHTLQHVEYEDIYYFVRLASKAENLATYPYLYFKYHGDRTKCKQQFEKYKSLYPQFITYIKEDYYTFALTGRSELTLQQYNHICYYSFLKLVYLQYSFDYTVIQVANKILSYDQNLGFDVIVSTGFCLLSGLGINFNEFLKSHFIYCSDDDIYKQLNELEFVPNTEIHQLISFNNKLFLQDSVIKSLINQNYSSSQVNKIIMESFKEVVRKLLLVLQEGSLLEEQELYIVNYLFCFILIILQQEMDFTVKIEFYVIGFKISLRLLQVTLPDEYGLLAQLDLIFKSPLLHYLNFKVKLLSHQNLKVVEVRMLQLLKLIMTERKLFDMNNRACIEFSMFVLLLIKYYNQLQSVSILNLFEVKIMVNLLNLQSQILPETQQRIQQAICNLLTNLKIDEIHYEYYNIKHIDNNKVLVSNVQLPLSFRFNKNIFGAPGKLSLNLDKQMLKDISYIENCSQLQFIFKVNHDQYTRPGLVFIIDIKKLLLLKHSYEFPTEFRFPYYCTQLENNEYFIYSPDDAIQIFKSNTVIKLTNIIVLFPNNISINFKPTSKYSSLCQRVYQPTKKLQFQLCKPYNDFVVGLCVPIVLSISSDCNDTVSNVEVNIGLNDHSPNYQLFLVYNDHIVDSDFSNGEISVVISGQNSYYVKIFCFQKQHKLQLLIRSGVAGSVDFGIRYVNKLFPLTFKQPFVVKNQTLQDYYELHLNYLKSECINTVKIIQILCTDNLAMINKNQCLMRYVNPELQTITGLADEELFLLLLLQPTLVLQFQTLNKDELLQLQKSKQNITTIFDSKEIYQNHLRGSKLLGFNSQTEHSYLQGQDGGLLLLFQVDEYEQQIADFCVEFGYGRLAEHCGIGVSRIMLQLQLK